MGSSVRADCEVPHVSGKIAVPTYCENCLGCLAQRGIILFILTKLIIKHQYQKYFYDHLQFRLGEKGFSFRKKSFSTGSGNRGFLFWQRGSLPGQEVIRLAKKGGGSSIARCGLPRFVVEPSLSLRVSLRKERGREEVR